jgi:hypothetical protein
MDVLTTISGLLFTFLHATQLSLRQPNAVDRVPIHLFLPLLFKSICTPTFILCMNVCQTCRRLTSPTLTVDSLPFNLELETSKVTFPPLKVFGHSSSRA